MTTETAPPTEPPAEPPAAGETPPVTDPPADPPADPPSDPPPAATDPPADPKPPADPPQSTKSDAAKKGHTTRQKRAQRRSELAEDADVQVLLDQSRKAGAQEAKEQAAVEAKRSSMSELERAQAEAKDAVARADAAEVELKGQRGEREYGDALLESEIQVLPKSRKIFRAQVAEAMATDATLTHADAITVVATEHDNLLVPTAPGTGAPAPQSKRTGATTAPPPKRETAAPATTEPPKPTDVMGMSKKDFRAHRAKAHGIHTPF